MSLLKSLNRLFNRQTLYPILLSTFLACILFAARVFRSRSLAYGNLVWNLFLAWLPYLFALLSAGIHRRSQNRWWVLLPLGFLWLIFFPNAPYILTDFLHLEQRPSVPLWYDILMLASFTWTGLFLAVVSLKTMQTLVAHYLGRIVSWLFVGIALNLGGLGIYLGRFSRFNSWDLFLQPREVFYDVAIRFINPLNNPRFFGFTALFSAFLLVVYLTFISVHRVSETTL